MSYPNSYIEPLIYKMSAFVDRIFKKITEIK